MITVITDPVTGCNCDALAFVLVYFEALISFVYYHSELRSLQVLQFLQFQFVEISLPVTSCNVYVGIVRARNGTSGYRYSLDIKSALFT